MTDSASHLFTKDLKLTPYWWDAAPRPNVPPRQLPKQVDVAIVGSGYAGLSAALTLSRNGRECAVLESHEPGFGASTRSAGHVARQLKWSYRQLVEKFGHEDARNYYREVAVAHDYVEHLIRSEQISCQFHVSHRFYSAHSVAAYERLARSVEPLSKDIDLEVELVPKSEQSKYVGSDAYFGGLIIRGTGMLQPALYHQGLLDRAVSSGVAVFGHTTVTDIQRQDQEWSVSTSNGRLRARDVLIATNGYTGPYGNHMRFLRRRVIPVRSYQCTTETLSAERLKQIIPSGIPVLSTHKVNYNLQITPDSSRLLFGGKAGRQYRSLQGIATTLLGYFQERFPAMRDVRISHIWDGQFAFTFDYLPHCGRHDGIYYVLGCCGTGIPMATYLGHKIGLKLLGKAEGATVFDNRSFPTVPFYKGDPWFLPAVANFYDLKDAIN